MAGGLASMLANNPPTKQQQTSRLSIFRKHFTKTVIGITPSSHNYLLQQIQTFLLHTGLVISCALYIVFGALMFYTIERPNEIHIRNRTLLRLTTEKNQFINDINSIIELFDNDNDNERQRDIEYRFDDYIELMLDDIFVDPLSAIVFESHCTHAYAQTTAKDQWTFETAILFAATTVIPVGACDSFDDRGARYNIHV